MQLLNSQITVERMDSENVQIVIEDLLRDEQTMTIVPFTEWKAGVSEILRILDGEDGE